MAIKAAKKHSVGSKTGKPSAVEHSTPLYPGLYGWQVIYQLADGSVAVCACLREAWCRYFAFLHDELAGDFFRTHHQQIEGKRLLELAFNKFARSVNPIALKALFPTVEFLSDEPSLIDGKYFFFGNRDIKPPELDDAFWNLPGNLFPFHNNLCEVCTGRVPSHYYCHQMYGSPFAQVYGAWIKAELVRQGHIRGTNDINQRKVWNDAENKMRLIVGVPRIGERFVSETILFKTVAFLLNEHEVIHHYRADWLARQELDIFVPSLNLAIEYQGEQHFLPIEAWGGESALEMTQQRDEEKKRRCAKKGVQLLYFDHTMELTEKFVQRRLEKILGEQIEKDVNPEWRLKGVNP